MAEKGVREYVAEFVGTFLLVLTVGCNVLGKTPVWTGVSIACVLMVSIYALGGVSGGNFNPAVSFALGLTNSMGAPNGMDWKSVGMYMFVQTLAGIIAALTYAILFWNAFNLGPTKGFGFLSASLCEMLYTCMLCFVVLNVAAAKAYAPPNGNQFYGLAIGFVVIAGAYGAGVVSGGCFNPAVAIGIDVSSAAMGLGWCIVYTIMELIGAALAAVLFKVVRPEDFGRSGSEVAKKLTAEFLGTFFLVLTVGLNVLGNSPAGAFSIAASLMSMIYALGDISGAHFNPAVTLAIFASKDLRPPELTPKLAGLYMVAQIAGGMVAAFTYAFIHSGNTFALGPRPGYRWGQVAIAEIIFTFVLCYVVLSVACTPKEHKTHANHMFGLAIGSCVTVGGFAIGSISGGCLNPAVAFGIASSQIMNGGYFYKALIYSGFEFIGAGAAAGLAIVTHGKKVGM